MVEKKCKIFVDDEVNARIGGLRPEHLEHLWDKFGVFVDGYRYMPAYQLRRWDGKLRFFEKTGKTYTKLLEQIVPILDSLGYMIELEDKRLPVKVITDHIDADIFGTDFKFRPYQIDVVNKLIDAGSGFAICATGSGKTSMVCALSLVLVNNSHSVIVIVPSTDLVEQTATEFRERLVNFPEITVGTYSGDTKEIDHRIVVATWQSLQNAPHLMGNFTALVVDEAHGAAAEVIRELINLHGRHISYRYGVTGTFPKPETDQLTLQISIGTIHARVPAAWLIEQGYLSSLEIEPVETQDDGEDLPDYSSEKAYLSRSEDRLFAIARLIEKKRDAHGNTMALVNSIAQGQALQELIPGSIFLYGDTDKKVRKENYDQYKDRNDLIVIASFGIASTGISIDRIFHLFLIDAGKSFVRAIQSVGRGLRKKGDKNHIYITDLHSKMKYSKKHFKLRKQYYTEAGYPLGKTLKLHYTQVKEDGLVF
jgi:superfamily II DNA or RNA helicase